MKATIVKSLMAMLVSAFAFTFTSCSSDDEPKVSSVEEISSHIESVVNSHLGELYGNEALDHLLLPVDNDAEAQEVVEAFIREEWNGQDYTYQVPGDCGRIRIRKDTQDGLYYTMVFSINDHMPFTFQLCTPGYPENENLAHSLQHIIDSWQHR
jgi:hypothetical protein